MAEEEGGRWDVGIKDNAVYLARISHSEERLLHDQLAPEEARHLAELLNKYAGKVDESAAIGDRGDDSGDDEDSSEDDDEKDSSDDEDDDEDDDGGDEEEDEDADDDEEDDSRD